MAAFRDIETIGKCLVKQKPDKSRGTIPKYVIKRSYANNVRLPLLAFSNARLHTWIAMYHTKNKHDIVHFKNRSPTLTRRGVLSQSGTQTARARPWPVLSRCFLRASGTSCCRDGASTWTTWVSSRSLLKIARARLEATTTTTGNRKNSAWQGGEHTYFRACRGTRRFGETLVVQTAAK